jgi:putative FmdB family regulatory protein
MPIYEYRCEACEHEFETLQGMKSPKLKKCPECKAPELTKLVSRPGHFDLRGEGFYQNDYPKDKN